MYITVLLIVIFIVLTIISMFTVQYIKENRKNSSANKFMDNQQTQEQISQIDKNIKNKQYNPRKKVRFDERDKNFIRNSISALEMTAVTESELKFLEYFNQSLFFDNTRVEDCVALKLLIEKYLDLNVWKVSLNILEEHIL